MKESGRIINLVFKEVEAKLRPGMSTADVDKLALKVITRKVAPTFKGYGDLVHISVFRLMIH